MGRELCRPRGYGYLVGIRGAPRLWLALIGGVTTRGFFFIRDQILDLDLRLHFLALVERHGIDALKPHNSRSTMLPNITGQK